MELKQKYCVFLTGVINLKNEYMHLFQKFKFASSFWIYVSQFLATYFFPICSKINWRD